ncbi:MAG TPA: transposase [Acidimicrobiia bacterium]|nr:transposase [Acidimicrobiia bacterium]
MTVNKTNLLLEGVRVTDEVTQAAGGDRRQAGRRPRPARNPDADAQETDAGGGGRFGDRPVRHPGIGPIGAEMILGSVGVARFPTAGHFASYNATAHIEASSGSSEYVFRAPQRGSMRDDGFRVRFWNPAVEAVGFDGLRFHDLRHSHAARLIADGQHMTVIFTRSGIARYR